MNLFDELQSAGTETIATCNACQTTRCVQDRRFGSLLGLHDPFGVMRCLGCDLRWLSPRPSPEGYRILYSDKYYFSPTDLPDYELFAEQRKLAFDDRIRTLIATWGISSILDFGAATGTFVAAARLTGLHAEGIELSSDARQRALDLHQVSLYSPKDFELTTDRFDVIHMNHVLEHMPDPSAHLKWCFERLPPNGGIVIEVPQQVDNDVDRLRRLFNIHRTRPKFDAFSVHHTYFFSPASLQQLVKRAGFTIDRLTTTNAPLNGNSRLRRKLLWRVATFAASLHSGGDTIELWARKQPITSKPMSRHDAYA